MLLSSSLEKLELASGTIRHTSVYYVLQSQLVATGHANNKIHKEAVKIDIQELIRR